MKRRTRHNFTLIELLAVMLLMGALTLMMLPAFNQMIRGNKVDQMSANLMLGLEQAQARAASARRHVAIVLPTQTSIWSGSGKSDAENAVLPYCYGGFRLAYVEPMTTSTDWKFVRWVPDSEWKNAPDGAMLINVYKSSNSNYELAEGAGVKAHVSNLSSGKDFASVLGNLKGCQLIPETAATAKDISNSLIVFSPYGGLAGSQDEDLRLVIAEAVPTGNSLAFPSRDSDGPTNWKMLAINKFTGRVEIYPTEY